MNRITFLVAIIAAPFLCAATMSQGNLYGRYNDGVYQAPGKLFKMSSPFPEEAIVSDGQQPENNHAGAASFIDQSGHLLGVLYMENKDGAAGADAKRNDSWRGMAVVARGKHYYLLQTELRVEKLAAPDWSYDANATDWNAFVPELEALYGRIEFLKL
jgi:hypothetical protein